jgi:glycerol-3-phosphate O-acyltransferase
MTEPVILPQWLVLLLAAGAAWTLLDRVLWPLLLAALGRRERRVVEDMNRRLHIPLGEFRTTSRRVLVDRLLHDPQVRAAIARHSAESGEPLERVRREAEGYAREIVPAFSALLYYRLGYGIARRVARLLYRLRVSYADEAALQAVPADAAVVFVINHRSNMDYVLVGYLVAERAAVSYAVGEWARVWPVQGLVRSMGAYFVRRGSRNDLYRRVLERYVAMATGAGVPQAIFPEGRLSRDGRLGSPRLGLLDYLLRSVGELPREVVFVPVGLNYDRTLEDRTLLLDLEPGARRPGTLASVLRTLRFVLRNASLWMRNRWFRFGYACVNFGTPIELSSWLESRDVRLAELPREERFAVAERLGAELMSSIGELVPVLPVPVVASVLLSAPGPLEEEEVTERVLAELDRLEAAGIPVHVPRGDRRYAVEVGLRGLQLRRLVTDEGGLLRIAPGQEPILCYYAGSIEQHLARGAPGGVPAPTP